MTTITEPLMLEWPEEIPPFETLSDLYEILNGMNPITREILRVIWREYWHESLAYSDGDTDSLSVFCKVLELFGYEIYEIEVEE